MLVRTRSNEECLLFEFVGGADGKHADDLRFAESSPRTYAVCAPPVDANVPPAVMTLNRHVFGRLPTGADRVVYGLVDPSAQIGRAKIQSSGGAITVGVSDTGAFAGFFSRPVDLTTIDLMSRSKIAFHCVVRGESGTVCLPPEPVRQP